MRNVCISSLLVLALLFGCTAPRQNVIYDEELPCYSGLKLASINIKDRGGLTETISNQDRLEQYENIDFLDSQPYTKVLRVFQRDPCGNVFAVLTTYHDNGLPFQYLEIMNNRAMGTYKEWYSNGNLKLEAKLISGTPDVVPHAQVTWVFDGPSKAWDESGCLAAEIPYSKGKLEGVSVYYYPNGNKWREAPFENGQLNGEYNIFYEEGDLAQTTPYKEGLQHGDSSRYWEGGGLAARESYSKGLLNEGYYHDTEGNEIAKVVDGFGHRAEFGKDRLAELQEYQEGVLAGEVKVFNEDGRLVKNYFVKDGKKNGPETFYYASKRNEQKPKLLIQWVDNKIHGMVKTWYQDGGIESQREMADNKKNGLYTAWYRDGSVMMIEQYEKDHLVKGEYFRIGEKIPVSTILEGKGLATLHDNEGRFLKKIEYAGGKPAE